MLMHNDYVELTLDVKFYDNPINGIIWYKDPNTELLPVDVMPTHGIVTNKPKYIDDVELGDSVFFVHTHLQHLIGNKLYLKVKDLIGGIKPDGTMYDLSFMWAIPCFHRTSFGVYENKERQNQTFKLLNGEEVFIYKNSDYLIPYMQSHVLLRREFVVYNKSKDEAIRTDDHEGWYLCDPEVRDTIGHILLPESAVHKTNKAIVVKSFDGAPINEGDTVVYHRTANHDLDNGLVGVHSSHVLGSMYSQN